MGDQDRGVSVALCVDDTSTKQKRAKVNPKSARPDWAGAWLESHGLLKLDKDNETTDQANVRRDSNNSWRVATMVVVVVAVMMNLTLHHQPAEGA